MTTLRRLEPRLAITVAALSLLVTRAAASTISVAAEIPLTANTFALPIVISAGIEVIGWQFDLSYDPTDVQVNTACDPFGGDMYCSLLTGPVTEGDFFVSGTPFNLLNPGFVALNPATLAQTGSLFGVNGAFGGFPPSPSGDGILAFVEFTLLGQGTSPIFVNGSDTSATSVPEPGALALLATGLALPRARRLFGRSDS